MVNGILHSSSTIHVLPVLKSFMYDALERELVDRRVPSRTQPGCSIIICKCCFTSLDRCSKKGEEQRHGSSDKCRGASRIYSYNIPTTPSRKRSSSQLAAVGTNTSIHGCFISISSGGCEACWKDKAIRDW